MITICEVSWQWFVMMFGMGSILGFGFGFLIRGYTEKVGEGK